MIRIHDPDEQSHILMSPAVRLCLPEGYPDTGNKHQMRKLGRLALCFCPMYVSQLVICVLKAASTFVHKCQMRHAEMREMLMWTFSRGTTQKWEKCWCGRVVEVQRTAFVCAANIRWTGECYLFGAGTSKKNTFVMLDVCLTRPTPKKPLSFGFASVLHATCVCIHMSTYLKTSFERSWFPVMAHHEPASLLRGCAFPACSTLLPFYNSLLTSNFFFR